MVDRFGSGVPHEVDDRILERCEEEVRNYDVYMAYVEPRDHTVSYIAAAYIQLAKKYDELKNEKQD